MKQVASSPAVDESSFRYAGWAVTGGAFTGVMFSFAPIVPFTFSLFLNPLHAAFGWKREALGAAFALAAMTVALVSPCCSTASLPAAFCYRRFWFSLRRLPRSAPLGLTYGATISLTS